MELFASPICLHNNNNNGWIHFTCSCLTWIFLLNYCTSPHPFPPPLPPPSFKNKTNFKKLKKIYLMENVISGFRFQVLSWITLLLKSFPGLFFFSFRVCGWVWFEFWSWRPMTQKKTWATFSKIFFNNCHFNLKTTAEKVESS